MVTFLALKEFQDLCENNIVLIATNSTTVVAYINKDWELKLIGPSMCPSLENADLVFQKAGYSQSPTHSRPSKCGCRQIGISEWYLLSEVVHVICNRWQQPQTDLFSMRFNNKLVQFVSSVPDPLAWAVSALTLPWEDLDPYAFPPVTILGKLVEKLQDYPCRRIILIAPVWPNMPWFWDLVTTSSQIPLCLPHLSNLVTLPFNQTPHRNLSNLNLHHGSSCLSIKEQGFSEVVAARIEDQPDQSMGQSGPFLQSGVSVIRCTSRHPCKASSRLPTVPVPRQEVTTKYYWCLQISHCWQTGNVAH